MADRILVTGGAGYIGSHATEALIRSGYSVTILDNLSTGYRELLNPKAQFIEGAVQNTELVARILKDQNIRGILHFAAFTGVSESLQRPDLYYENNFGGTLSLLRACQQVAVDYFIFSSTAAVYDDPGTNLVTESSPTSPITPYGRSKLFSERAIAEAAAPLRLKYMILRYFNVAGASDSLEWGQKSSDLSVLIKRAAMVAAGKVSSLSIFGTDYPTKDGTAVRDFIHVEDQAELHVFALQYLAQGGSSDLVNCGYGHGYSVREVVEAMKRASGRAFHVNEEARRPGDLPQVVASNEKVKRLFRWGPKRDDLDRICRSAYLWEKKT